MVIVIRKTLHILFVSGIFFAGYTGLTAQDHEVQEPKISWLQGPMKADLGPQAEIQLPRGYRFANGDDSRKIMVYYGNQPTNLELGYVEPLSKENWFIIFEFEDSGYVKDTGEKLDVKAIFESLEDGTKAGNEWRKKNGLPELKLIGWHEKPHYDEKTHNLEWGTVNESMGQQVINYNIRILGREGVMSATIVGDREIMESAIQSTRLLLKNYDYKSGKKYSEWQEGDKIAGYGLAALITGGAAVAAAKSGLLAKFWKFILIGLVAIGAFFKKIWGTITGKKSNEETRV